MQTIFVIFLNSKTDKWWCFLLVCSLQSFVRHLQVCEMFLQTKSKVKFRFQEFEEAEEFCVEAARATRDLARAEAEIELLQQLLKQKEEQVR